MSIQRTTNTHYNHGGSVIHLGNGHGFHWYVYGNLVRHSEYQRLYEITGGEDLLQAYIEHDSIVGLDQVGDRALPHIELLIDKGVDERDWYSLIQTLGRINTDASQNYVSTLFSISHPRYYEHLAKTVKIFHDDNGSGLGFNNNILDILVPVLIDEGHGDELVRHAINSTFLNWQEVSYDRKPEYMRGCRLLSRIPIEFWDKPLTEIIDTPVEASMEKYWASVVDYIKHGKVI